MNILIEANIPYIKGILEPFGKVTYLPATEIDRNAVRDTDALFVRTRTRCNRALLEGSRVKFIATATIGTDHIDLDYCRLAGITVCNAPGCNAPAVAQYVFASIAAFFGIRRPDDMTIGVVGVGHVGSIVARWGRRLGFRVLRCDPPRLRREGGDFVSLQTVCNRADIITLHTPLTHDGDDATLHMADSRFFDKVRRCKLLINSARGSIVDTPALVNALDNHKVGAAAIDCWENEPSISTGLLDRAVIATPHIAGYSAEGKMRATAMVLQQFADHFGLDVQGIPDVSAPACGSDVNSLDEILTTYNPLDDTLRLKWSPSSFESLRNNYALRHEVC